MILGEKISKLRIANNMSQGDLAEKVNVSRQSVSKWETDTSIPDLDKLILISELFGVSIDSLVKETDEASQGEKTTESDEKTPKPQTGHMMSTQKIMGFILLGVGLLSAVLGLALNLALLYLAAYILLCGILCVSLKKHAGKVIGWITYLLIAFYLPRATSTSMRAIFVPVLYQQGLYIQLAVSYAMWACLFLLLYATLRRTKIKRYTLLIFGWLVFSKTYGYIPIVFGQTEYEGTTYLIISLLTILLLAVLIFFTARAVVLFVKQRRTNS